MIITETNTFRRDSVDIIYDIFVSDKAGCRQLVIIGPLIPSKVKYQDLQVFHKGHRLPMTIVSDPHKHTFLSKCRIEKAPEYLIRVRYQDASQDYMVKDYTAKDLTLYRKTALTTIFKDENNLIRPWIEYHRKIGFELFFLYNNNPSNRAHYSELESEYSDAIVLIDWPFQYRYLESGFSGQTTQQNHTIWKYSELILLGLTDLDEYIVPQKLPINIPKGFSGISIQSYFFGCNHGTEFTDLDFIEKLTRRKQQSEGPNYRHKTLIIPEHVQMHSVHDTLVSQRPVKKLNPSEIQINHYLVLSQKNRKCDHKVYDKVLDERILTFLKSDNENEL